MTSKLSMKKCWMLAGIAAISFPALAAAQAADAPKKNDGYGEQFGDIIVTAQKRSEAARDVPLSITAHTGEFLQATGVVDSRDLTLLTPGLKMDRVGGFSFPSIRGITSTLSQAGADGAVAIYLDGIYVPSQTMGTFDLPDVQRVEVLKGPQGTLFGRNATGGAIQVFSRDPKYTTEGKLFASYGNFNEAIVKGFATAPVVTDKIAVSVSGYYRRADGYNKDLLNGGEPYGKDKAWAVHGKIKLDPTEQLSIVLSGLVSSRRDAGSTSGYAIDGNTYANFSLPDAVIPTRPYEVASNFGGSVDKAKMFSAKATLDLGSISITSLTGYLKTDSYIYADADMSYTSKNNGILYYDHDDTESFSQELNIASSNEGMLNYTAGLYYIKANGAYNPLRILVDIPAFNSFTDIDLYGRSDNEAYAAFGELYLKPTSRLQFIAGLRYSYEKRRYSGAVTLHNLPKPPLAFKNQKSFDGWTPRFSVRYEVVDDTNVYFTYSQGFKSGSFNTSDTSPDGGASLNPEKVYAYEVGVKSKAASWLDINLAGFYYKYRDIQVNAYKTLNGLPVAVLENAAAANIKGLDLEAFVRPVNGLTLQAGLSVLDATFSSFGGAAVLIPNKILTNGAVNGGNTSIVKDVTGNKLVRSPDWTLTLTAMYRTAVAGGELELNGNMYHSDKFWFEVGNRVGQPAYTTFGAQVRFTPDNLPLTFGIFGKNLTDKAVRQGSFVNEIADGIMFASPRTYGVSVEYNF